MSSATRLPTTRKKRDEALRAEFNACVVLDGDEKLEPTVSQLLGSKDESWWGSENIRSHERPPRWIWFHLPVVHVTHASCLYITDDANPFLERLVACERRPLKALIDGIIL
jgi:hypothetical protein